MEYRVGDIVERVAFPSGTTQVGQRGEVVEVSTSYMRVAFPECQPEFGECGPRGEWWHRYYAKLIQRKEDNVKKPHKHAELIKAWADGAKIQFRSRSDSEWMDIHTPNWVEYGQYRVKPEVGCFRVGLTTVGPRVLHHKTHEARFKSSKHFVRWLTDWQEYEV